MKTKTLLINLPCYLSMKDFVENDYGYNPSLGLLAIAEYLGLFEFETKVIDYNYTNIDYESLERIILDENYSVVGITAYTENLNLVLKFSKTIKKINKHITVVVGGPHATLKPEDIVKSRYVDCVTVRDGEATFLELLSYFEFGGEFIPKQALEGVIFNNEPYKIRDNVTDLSLLPIINRDKMDSSKYKNVVTIYSSKGCPGKCIYCAASFISGARYRIRNVYSIFLECWLIYYQLNKTVDRLFFIDDTFTVHKKRTKDFCHLVKKYNYPLLWSCESRIDVMKKETIDLFTESNCYAIQFGVESGSQYVLDTIKKNIDLAHLEEIVSYASKYAMEIFLGFMLGHYVDTIETMQDTINYIKRMLKINQYVQYSVSINTPFPGTWQYEHANEIGLTITDFDYSHYNLITPVIKTKFFDKVVLEKLFEQANALRVTNNMEKESK